MKKLLIILLGLMSLMTVSILVLIWMMIEPSRRVPVDARTSQEDLLLARRLVRLNSEGGAGLTELSLTMDELEAALSYGLRSIPGAGLELDADNDRLALSLSLNVPGLGDDNFLNIEAALVPDLANPSVATLQIGRLVLTEEQATWLAGLLYSEARLRYPEIREIEQVIEYVELDAQELQVGIRRNRELEARLYERGRDYYLPADLRERMLIHARHLDDLLNNYQQGRLVPVSALFAPMMQYARELGADPVRENRALIMVLASYVMEIDLNQLLGINPQSNLTLRRIRVTAGGRIDFAQHFLGAAGLALSAGNEMAELLALAKELSDTDSGGSGFSFTDLGADRAGARFSALATAGPEQALLVQDRLGRDTDESWFLPDLQGLPEYMTDAEMQARYGGYEGPEYEAVIDELEARLNNVPMFAELRAL